MDTIKKITVNYDPAEDRLSLAVLTHSDTRMLLWLTFRMAQGIASHLTSKMEEMPTSARADTPQQSARPSASLQGWEQLAAAGQITAQTPVSPKAPELQVLINSVTLSLTASRGDVLFRWPVDDGGVRLTMNITELRQWLHIVYQRFQVAGWRLDAWPEWIADPDTRMPTMIRQ